MPYDSTSDLPEQFREYGQEAQQAALDALNGCLYEGEADEERCFKMAHTAARNVAGREGGGGNRPGGGRGGGPGGGAGGGGRY